MNNKLDKNDLKIMARMASSQYQQKYIDNATKDQYIVPEELLEDILSILKRVILYSNDTNKESILNLYTYCMKECDNMPNDSYNSEQWSNIRTAVSNHLSHIEQFNIINWENSENA